MASNRGNDGQDAGNTATSATGQYVDPGTTEIMSSPAMLHLVDGSQQHVSSLLLFQPTPSHITVILDDDESPRIMPLTEISYIQLEIKPSCFPKSSSSSPVEDVETVDGICHQVAVPPDQELKTGFYGFTSQKSSFLNHHFFFPFCNVKQRAEKRRLGEIMTAKGMISEKQLADVLNEQRERRSHKLGAIIAEQAHILPAIVEHEIHKAYSENKQMPIGRILMETGLVNEELVQVALRAQQRLHKKLGQLMLEKGTVSDEQVYSALAEKFRIPLVDLEKVVFSRKAIKLLPREVAIKYLLMPIRFKNDSLQVATIFPDVAALKDYLKHYTKQADIRMVLARPGQLRAAIMRFYPAPDDTA